MSDSFVGFTTDEKESRIRKVFKQRYSVEPEVIFNAGTAILAGPIPGNDSAGDDEQYVMFEEDVEC
jgi:hypothetical protein